MTNLKTGNSVLVTGGSGFVGAHCILQLLDKGNDVKTTIRSLNKKPEVIEMLKNGGAGSVQHVSFIEANLSKDTNWDEAAKNCEYVLHVASPISLTAPKDENEMIVPAVEGTLRVLRASRDAGVKRVVITSSFAAVGYSHTDPNTLITEESWTDPNDKSLSAYLKSKTLAEKAAWDFMRTEGGALELSVVNPVAIFGPSLSPNLSGGLEILKQLLDGSMKAIPNINFGIVDVRDVADLHLRAMTSSEAKGQRFLALAGGVLSLHDIALMLKQKMGDEARKVTTKKLPDFLVRIAALFNPAAKNIVSQLGRIKNASNEKAKILLGWTPRTNEEAIMASAESLVRFGLIKSSTMVR
ncbi:MAG TPA: aldehyde reductase [Blastocatellia bacterium]|nr:aldehyde reductase [Blastocatellia bacterium]